ncbi:type I polyketide synthase [Streptomyces olivaceus]|uniref:type I polyketide synthase n=1 Tax=Streptomyces olivaceus TaxID=47716 RepID=UPI001CCB9DF0|nr:type I polyketide synthase [Streptomyces olivaceus]MBZ6113498.1 acyltransferase domain-containing protein [Streptomyces olivaceus]MBZ6127271.1 acyltransferase domain-containing protein [Streptomyces olivaceus]MBZ6148193.1 acyltransferase domain-containing protein [Streptomyces olivaceus]MBZ6161684.1 acyltransferase domain-containing protein [Streptomyces olivaceus]MBZ6189771.1 acyltransferase domain-containing protein [Streptomyces olivaceus]
MEALSERELRQRIGALVEEVLGRAADPQVSFLDLGLNSLALMRVKVLLEATLGLSLDDAALFEHSSVAALAAHLAPAADPGPQGSGSAPAATDGRIAVIGMAARLPGAPDLASLWENLRAGRSSVRTLGNGQGDDGRVRAAGVVDDAECFDADHFGMSRKESALTDPAHRLFLECCAHALEDGGYAGQAHGRRVGVYAGGGMNLYGPGLPYFARHGMGGGAPSANVMEEMQGLIGGQQDFLATRVAYRLGLTGAAVAVQSACSTGLVAVHLAAQSLLSGENDLVLAGAAAVHLPQTEGYVPDPEFILSPSGVCRAFDAASDGTVGGNGVAVVLLKRLDAALADGDEIQAVILGSAVNNDGAAKAGFTAPGVQGHTEVVRLALARAGIDADSVGHVEAHGTGTELGDLVEFEALSRAYRSERGRTEFCTLGSVKPSLGHLDTCAGMAGLVKTVLMLRHGIIAPTANVTRPSPRLPWETSPFRLATVAEEWRTSRGVPRRGGVSALGFGGTNAHVLFEEPPAATVRPQPAHPLPVPISARSQEALHEVAVRLRDELRARPGLGVADVHTTLALGRAHQSHRTVVHGRTAAELADGLDRFLRLRDEEQPATAGPIAFAFSGQGQATAGMARELYRQYAVVREVLDECEETYRQEEAQGSLLDVLLTPPSDGAEVVTQAAQFALQMALVRLWRQFGVEPDCVLGHSLGEMAALCTAGAFSLADGLRFTTARGNLVRAAAPGRMLAVHSDADTVRELCAGLPVEIAAVNGPRSLVLSGDPEAIEAAAHRVLAGEDIACRPLDGDRAFHSALLDPVLPALREAAESLTFTPLRLPCGASARGEVLPAGSVVDAEHLVRQARRPVLFQRTLAAVHALGHVDFLELGPAGVLTSLGRTALPGTHWIATQSGESAGAGGLHEALAELYRRGLSLDWRAMATGGGRVRLPGYPFRREPYPTPELPRLTRAKTPVQETPPPTGTASAPIGPAAAPEPSTAARIFTAVAGQQLASMEEFVDGAHELMSAQLSTLSGLVGGDPQ